MCEHHCVGCLILHCGIQAFNHLISVTCIPGYTIRRQLRGILVRVADRNRFPQSLVASASLLLFEFLRHSMSLRCTYHTCTATVRPSIFICKVGRLTTRETQTSVSRVSTLLHSRSSSTLCSCGSFNGACSLGLRNAGSLSPSSSSNQAHVTYAFLHEREEGRPGDRKLLSLRLP